MATKPKIAIIVSSTRPTRFADLPTAWIARMKRAVRTLGWRFNADRMVMDYVTETYVPAAGSLSCDMKIMP